MNYQLFSSSSNYTNLPATVFPFFATDIPVVWQSGLSAGF